MALVRCPDCGSEVSDSAPACPRCGRPIAAARAAAPREGPFLQTLNAGCVVVLISILVILALVLIETIIPGGK